MKVRPGKLLAVIVVVSLAAAFATAYGGKKAAAETTTARAVVTVLAHHVGGGLPAGVSIGPSPSGSIACDAAGNLYVVDFPSGNVLKIAVGH